MSWNIAGLALALGLFVVEPPPEPVEISLAVDSLQLGPDVGPRVELQLHGPMSQMLKLQAFEVQGPGGAPMKVVTSLSYLDERNRNYAVHIDFIDEHGNATPLVEWFTCLACTERRLVEQTLAAFQSGAERLHAVVPGTSVAVTPPPPVVRQPIAPIGRLGYVGVGVSAGGLATLVVGTASLVTTDNEHVDVLVGIGATALGLGIAAIVGDVVNRQRLRVQPSPYGLAIAFRL